MGKTYQYRTGSFEAMRRVYRGESSQDVNEEIKRKWTPGNEYLWDEYDIESLIDLEEKRSYDENKRLYARITLYRALWGQGRDVRGHDPMKHVGDVEGHALRLRSLFPETVAALIREESLRVQVLAVLPGSDCIYKEGRRICRGKISNVRTDDRTIRASFQVTATPGFITPGKDSWDIGAVWTYFHVHDEYWTLAATGISWRVFFNSDLIREVTELARTLSGDDNTRFDVLMDRLRAYMHRCEVNRSRNRQA